MADYLSMKGQKVILIFHPEFPLKRSNPVMGYYPEYLNDPVGVMVKEIDDFGIWIENPELEIQNIETKASNKYKANVLIKWEYILSIVRIPDKEVPKLPNEFGFATVK